MIDMPKPIYLGKSLSTTIGSLIYQEQDGEPGADPDLRRVMGFVLPAWQRGSVWSIDQQIRFIESAWAGMPLGTYTVNRPEDLNHPLSGYLLDGQQRVTAISEWLSDGFRVHGALWSEVSEDLKRRFKVTKFSSFETDFVNEHDAMVYYDLFNFGGTPHQENERAVPLDGFQP